MNRQKTFVMLGLVVLGVVAASVVGARMVLTTQAPVVNPNCLSLDDVKGIKQDFKVPTYLPAGYEYKCGIAEQGEANVIFWDQPVDKSTYRVSPIAGASISKGAILMRISDQPQITNTTKSAMDDYQWINKKNPALKPQLIDINGKLAWGNEAAPNGGSQTASFPDGQVITNSFDMPARLVYYEPGKIIHLEGFVHLQELVKAAKSIP